jgi:hypothetical protein
MGKFYDSEIVRKQMDEINEIQKSLWTDIATLFSMSKQEKEEHIDKLEELLQKQMNMYTRLQLAKGDPDADEMMERIKESATMMGFQDGNLDALFKTMSKTIESLRQRT